MAILNNNPLIGSGGQQGYSINNSVRFRSSASAYLNRTPASAGNRRTYTYSFWTKYSTGSADAQIFSTYGGSAGTFLTIGFIDSGKALSIDQYNGSTRDLILYTTQAFRDPSAWYHVVIAVDTTQATSTNRVKIYVNGNQVTAFASATYPSQNFDTYVNTTQVANIGRRTDATQYYDGYLADVNFIDGSAKTPSDFGETDTTTGVWKPKAYSGTYGTNGFYLKFSDIATTSGSNAGLGKDFSGNTNYWTTNNISVTSGTTYDAMTDSPTNTSTTVANYAVLNPLWKASTGTLSSANLNYTDSDSLQKYVRGTIGVTSGKWYFEGVFTNTTSAMFIGMSADTETSTSGNAYIGNSANGWSMQVTTTVNKVNNGTFTSISSTNYINTSNVFQVAYDADNGKLFFGVNNTWFGSADPVAGTNAQFTGVSGTLYPSIGTQGNGAVAINFGQRPFTYTPPTGFVALNTFNLPTPTILQGNKYMDANLWSGNSSAQTVVNQAQFKPDFVWVKSRTNTQWNNLTDSVRGVTKLLYSNATNAEATNSTALTSFNSNGFSVGDDSGGNGVNTSGQNYVGWQWQAGQGSTSSNTSGSITSTVSVNTTAGFSVVTYTGSGAAGTVGHGLGVAPAMIITKKRTNAGGGSAATNWVAWHKALSGAYSSTTGYIYFNDSAAAATTTNFYDGTAMTSTTFRWQTGNDNINYSNDTFVSYCWAEIAGFSKFGSYTGNGSTDGPFVYTGFRPKFLMIKASSTTGVWEMIDTSRDSINVTGLLLRANSSAAEINGTPINDILSNGFKPRSANGNQNDTGVTYIYMAFAENPFKNALAR